MRHPVIFGAFLLGCAFLVSAAVQPLDYFNFAADTLNSLTATSSATSTTAAAPATRATLVDVVRQLQDQIQYLANTVNSMRADIGAAKMRATFKRNLAKGDSGSDVRTLQEILIQIADIYPANADASSIVSGHYGPLTEAAMKRFQAQEGLKQTGVFDDETREKFYDAVSGLLVEDDSGVKLSPVDLSGLPDFQNLSDLQKQVADLSNATEAGNTNINTLQDEITELDSRLATAESNLILLQGETTNLAGSIPAPAQSQSISITNLATSSIAKNSVTITWNTNTTGTSEVDYSLNSSLTSPTIVTSSTLLTIHRVILSSLSASTKYYFKAVSRDASGGTISSPIQWFTTTP
jgi:peptidoglycan hydrolase-like protein with peptidoglycan-binding domain